MRKAEVFRRALFGGSTLRAVGASDAVVALLAERHGFDALWSSSLMTSMLLGLPDAGLITMTEALEAAIVTERASSLPVVLDAESGYGDADVVRRLVREAEACGLAAVSIEDKQHPKRNSFQPGNRLEDPVVFADKIEAAVEARRDDAFVVIARLESFIVNGSLQDALDRAELYTKAGADALLVHSKAPDADEIERFASEWGERRHTVPLVIVPTTYPYVPLRHLEALGIAMVIYANQPMRAAIRAIDGALASIASSGSTAAIEPSIAALRELFDLVEIPGQKRATVDLDGR